MKNAIVDICKCINKEDEASLKKDLGIYDFDILSYPSNEVTSETLMNDLVSRGYGRFAVLIEENSPLKPSFPNNKVVVNGENDFKNRRQAIVNSIDWIFSNCGRDKPFTSNVFFTSDTHFCHANIIRYCNRPWNSGKDANGDSIVTERDLYEMNEAIISNWNSVVSLDDVVWHLGDFALGNRSRIPEFVNRLNGHKKLVLGNHDFFHVDKAKYRNVIDFYEKAGFEEVYGHPVLLNNFVILSHEPLSYVKDPFFNCFGHVHSNDNFKTFSKSGCCVCVERHNYKPISWKTIYDSYNELKTDEGNN